MSEMTHTPTPWHTCGTFKDDGIETINIAAEDEYHVCKVSSRYGENEANAAYIVHCVNSHASLIEENKRMRKALERIERWHGEFPKTGKFWSAGDGAIPANEMSYGAAHGSNGERDFMRGVARAALGDANA